MPVRELSTTERLNYPYSAVGVIFVTFPDGSQASGTVAVVGRNDLLTATHVLYSPEHGGWVKSFNAYFGADYNQVLDRFDSSSFSYTLRSSTVAWNSMGWPNGVFADSNPATLTGAESQYDVGLIGLSVPIGDTTGWFGIDPNRNYTQNLIEVGFPSTGTGMMASTVTVTRDSIYDVYTATDAAMGPGSSGGPLFSSDWYVIGVKSAGSANRSTWADLDLVYSYLIDSMAANDSLLGTASLATPRYSVTASAASVNEGATAIFTISTQNVASGTRLSYQLSGVAAADLAGGQLSGTTVVGTDGRATVSIGIVADALTEGSETLVLTTNGTSAQTVINDTSRTQVQTGPSASDVWSGIGVYRAFYGFEVTSVSYQNMKAYMASATLPGYAQEVARGFAAWGSADLATSVLGDMGITASSLGGAAPAASYVALQFAVSTIFAMNAGARGQVVLNMVNLLSGLEGDLVFGNAARNFDSIVTANYNKLAALGMESVEVAALGVAQSPEMCW